jgi:GxxExxY protein
MEPQMNTDGHRLEELNRITEGVIGAAMRVSNALGCGFLEKVYENAMVLELRLSGFKVEPQRATPVHYRGEVVGAYVIDLLVDDLVLVELKAVQALDDVCKAQCINYLKATGLPVCLLINFGRPKLEIKRFMGLSAQQ